MDFTPAMRFAALALMGLCVAALTWRGFSIYQKDQRAQQSAALVGAATATSGGDGKEKGGAPAPATASASGSPSASAPAPALGSAPVPAQPAAQVKPSLIVHVEGAVKRPGVYTFEEGARVNDAVQAAGGALPDGLPGALNLAAPLTDGSKVYVYTKAELQPAPQAAEKVEARAAVYAPVKSTEAAAKPAAKQPPVVNLNTATAAELEAVPGIGPSTARAILEYRTKHGSFQKVDDLTAVSGIGPKTLEKLRPYLKV